MCGCFLLCVIVYVGFDMQLGGTTFFVSVLFCPFCLLLSCVSHHLDMESVKPYVNLWLEV